MAKAQREDDEHHPDWSLPTSSLVLPRDLQDLGIIGLGVGAKRATTSPLRPMMNFSKFQLIFPAPLGFASEEVRHL